jgi:hypothetical protein
MWDSQKRAGEPLGNMVDNPEHWILEGEIKK